MEKPIISKFDMIAPLIVQKYERYLPTAFDESLTLLEKVNKVIEYLNQTGALVGNLVDQWNDLFEWLLNDGLKEEVSKKINELYENGFLGQLLNDLLLKEKMFYFESVAEAKAYLLNDGDVFMTAGYHNANDGGHAMYKVSSDVVSYDEGEFIQLMNGKTATLIYSEKVNVKQFGAKGDYNPTAKTGTDDTQAFQKAFAFLKRKIKSFINVEGQHNRLWENPITLVLTHENYYLKNGVLLDAGFAITIEGNKASIFSDENQTKFKATGDMASVATYSDIYFHGSGIGFEYATNNRDQSMVQFNRCKFILNTEGVRYNNRSSIVTYNDCQWYHCITNVRHIMGDEAIYNGCWVSDVMHTTNYATSFTLEWGTHIFNECFLIPSGYYDSSLISQWEALSGLAWFEMLGNSKLILDKTRISSEPGFKNIINYRGEASATDPSKSCIIIRDTNNISAKDALIVLSKMPNRINIENINNTVANAKFIRLNTTEDVGYKFDETAFWSYMKSTSGRSKVANVITIRGNTCQLETQYELPEILIDFVKDMDFPVYKNFNGKSAKIFMGAYTTTLEKPSRKTYMVKASINSMSNEWNKSIIIGLLTIAIDRNKFYKLTFKPIVEEFTDVLEENKGTLNFTFDKTGTDMLDMRTSGVTDLTVTCSYTGTMLDSQAPYLINQLSYKEMML